MSLSASDIATDDIMTDILKASGKGESLVKEFVKDRLMENSTTNFFSRMSQNKSKTLGTM